MPHPRVIVIVSAHRENAPAALSLHYDFGGFQPRNCTLPYVTRDAAHLGRPVTAPCSTGPVHQFTDRGPFFPSWRCTRPRRPAVHASLEPQVTLELGRLRSLCDEGILVIGSGFMTHSFALAPQTSSRRRAGPLVGRGGAVRRGDVDTFTKAPTATSPNPPTTTSPCC